MGANPHWTDATLGPKELGLPGDTLQLQAGPRTSRPRSSTLCPSVDGEHHLQASGGHASSQASAAGLGGWENWALTAGSADSTKRQWRHFPLVGPTASAAPAHLCRLIRCASETARRWVWPEGCRLLSLDHVGTLSPEPTPCLLRSLPLPHEGP